MKTGNLRNNLVDPSRNMLEPSYVGKWQLCSQITRMTRTINSVKSSKIDITFLQKCKNLREFSTKFWFFSILVSWIGVHCIDLSSIHLRNLLNKATFFVWENSFSVHSSECMTSENKGLSKLSKIDTDIIFQSKWHIIV